VFIHKEIDMTKLTKAQLVAELEAERVARQTLTARLASAEATIAALRRQLDKPQTPTTPVGFRPQKEDIVRYCRETGARSVTPAELAAWLAH
jgi:hypothetical protein